MFDFGEEFFLCQFFCLSSLPVANKEKTINFIMKKFGKEKSFSKHFEELWFMSFSCNEIQELFRCLKRIHSYILSLNNIQSNERLHRKLFVTVCPRLLTHFIS